MRWRSLARVAGIGLTGRKTVFAGTVLGSAAISGIQLLPPLLLGAFLNVLVASPETAPAVTRSRMTTLIVEIVACVIGAAAVRYVCDLATNAVAGEATLALRARLHAAVLAMSTAARSGFDSGAIKYRIADDTGVMEQFVGALVPTIAVNVALCLGGLVLVALRAPFMALLVVVPAVLLAVGTVVVRRVTARLYEAEVTHSVTLWTRLGELVAGAKAITLYGREAHQQRLFVESAAALRRNQRGTVVANANYAQALGLTSAGCTYLLYYFGGLHVVAPGSTLRPGDLIALVPIAMFLFGPLAAIAGTIGGLWKSAAAAQRLCELLDAPADRHPDAPAEAHAFVPPPGPLTMRDVVFGYEPDREVLRGLSLHVDPGELVALVGRSGAGKTTTLSLLCRLYEPAAGTIAWGGVDARSVPPAAWRRAIGVVMQETYLFADSVFENIRCGRPWIGDREVARAAALAGVDAFVDALPDGYATRVGDGGSELSGGQRQRIGIARALASDPALLILDEPTSALDPETEAAFLDALAQVVRARMGIVIAHRLSTIRRADRVVVLADGRAREPQAFDELVRGAAEAVIV